MSAPDRSTVRERTVRTADGLDVAVQELGADGAPTVLLVHGYPDTHAVWDLVAERLARDHHVVTYDVRGAGASDAPADRDGYRMEHLVSDVFAVADAVAPGRPIHLVGHDWGSIQSWAAVTDPRAAARIASYTSMSGPSLDHAGAWFRSHLRPGGGRWTALRRQAVRSWYIAAFHTPVPALAWRNGLARAWPQMVARAEGADVDDRWPGPTLAADAVRGIELYRANMGGGGGRRVAVHTDVPVQLLVPAGDSYVTPALLDGIEAIAPTLVRREVGGGHWQPRSRPDQLARLIAEHVSAVEAGQRPASLTRRPVIVVTGAGSGIGRSVCLAFAERGAHIVVSDLRADTADRTAELCRLLGATAEAHALDVTDAEAVDAFAAKVGADHGGPTVVVNNAGLGMAGSFLATTDDDWRQLLDVNLWGVIRGSRAFGRLMVDHGETGHIVNIASAAAFTPSRTLPAYATSKSAVLMLTECLRAELAGEGIGVSAICPGFVDTGIATATRYVGATAAEQDAKRQSADRLYKRRRVTPDAVADAVLRAVDRDLPLVTVAAEAKAGRFTSRFAPRVARAIAKIDLSPPTRGAKPEGADR
ncbi:MAG: short chain dehydrogenase [Acidimicrobiales bacterium]|nr:short chain dehydrogenase [Acidimicrobiales bacterium]